MFKIKIHKDKITYNIFNEDSNKWEEQIDLDNSSMLSKYFNNEVEISEDVTFEDVMNILERFENDVNYCFAAYSQCIPLKTYLKEMRTDITHDLEIVQIELFRKGEISASEFSLNNSIRGFMSEESAERLGEEIDKPLSVDTYHVNALKKSKFYLNDNIVIVDYGNPSSSVNNEENMIFDGFASWTLHDLISTIMSVLTQNGTPSERDSVNVGNNYNFNSISKNKEEIKMWIGLFEEELKDKRDNKEEAISCERYEDAHLINGQILDLKEKIKDLKKQLSEISTDEQIA